MHPQNLQLVVSSLMLPQQFIERDRQFPNAFPRRVENRVGDCPRHTDTADLADSARP